MEAIYFSEILEFAYRTTIGYNNSDDNTNHYRKYGTNIYINHRVCLVLDSVS